MLKVNAEEDGERENTEYRVTQPLTEGCSRPETGLNQAVAPSPPRGGCKDRQNSHLFTRPSPENEITGAPTARGHTGVNNER